MDSLQFAILVIIHQFSMAGGVVTITFDDNGYIGQSIVLQCKTDATSIVSSNALWYFNSVLISSTSTGGFSETKTPDGFNLTISSLTTSHAGYYRCRIDFGSSSNKTLGIVYNTSIDFAVISNLTVKLTIIAYPAPVYFVTLTKNGILVTVQWTSSNITQPDGVINITLISPALNTTDYELTVNVTSPVAAFKHYFLNFAPTEPPGNATKCHSLFWCTRGWCIGLCSTSGGLLVISVVTAIGVIIITEKWKDIESHMSSQILTISIAGVVVSIIVVSGVLAGIVCRCWIECKEDSES